MERNISNTDCAFLLERKFFQCASIDDLAYFLGTSDAQVPQAISINFASKFKEMIDTAINAKNVQSVSTLTQVLAHIVQQDVADSMQHLISSKLHSNFDSMVAFYSNVISDKSCDNSGATRSFSLLISAIIDYSRRMNDHRVWLIQNMLHIILLTLGDPNMSIQMKMQTSEKFLNIFEDDDVLVSPCCRTFVQNSQELFDELSKRVLGSLHRSGHLQLQELIVEIIIRMWSTEMRKRKALKWFDNNTAISTAFLAISYDEFDYGVRMFLNEFNGSTEKRRILTISYKELQIGKQILMPSNQWCNCVDLCYGSKVLDVRYPHEETGLLHEHKCVCKLGSIRSSHLVSFSVTENSSLRTIDLHLKFQEPSCSILDDFSLDNQIASDLIIRFHSVANVNDERMGRYISSLFGSKFQVKRSAMYSVPKQGICGSGPWAVFGSQDGVADTSFIQLSQEQLIKTPQRSGNSSSQARNRHPADRNAPQHASQQFGIPCHKTKPVPKAAVPSQKSSQVLKASQSNSQMSMMRDLAMQAACKRNDGKLVKWTTVGTCEYTREGPVKQKAMSKTQHSQKPVVDQRQSQTVTNLMIQYARADIHIPAISSDSSNCPEQPVPPSKIQQGDDKADGAVSYSGLTSVPVSIRNQNGQRNEISSKPRLSADSKRIVHETESDRICGDSSDEFDDKKKKAQPQRKGDDTIPETQVDLNASMTKKLQHNTCGVGDADISVDLMMQCLHGSGVSDQPPQCFDIGNDHIDDEPSRTKRITRSQRQKQRGDEDSGKQNSTSTGSRRGNNKKDVNNGPKSAANKVNDQFEKLVSQFKENKTKKNIQESVEKVPESKAKPSNVGRKKKRSLLDADVWQQLDVMVPVEQADDPATRSVKKRPYAEKFIKHTTSVKKEKRARGKPKTSTRKALQNLNIEPRQDRGKNQTAEVRKQATVRKRRKKELSLPYGELEEVAEINDTQQNENVFSPIETVRDATHTKDVLSDFGSPTWLTSAKKKTETVMISDLVSNERTKGAKRKSRVSFDAGAKTDSQNDKKMSARYLRRKRKAHLFDSVSEATSGTASDPSWVADHDTQEAEKPENTYKGARLRRRQARKKQIKKRSLEQVLDSNFHCSVSEEEYVSPMTNNSVLSGVSVLQSLGSASNMDFDQIAAENGCLPSVSDIEAPPTRLCDISDIGLDWNKIDLTLPTSDDALNEEGKTDDTSDRSSASDHNREKEAKVIEEYHDLETAQANNNTPTESKGCFNFGEKTFQNRKKAATHTVSPMEHKKYLKSKKKLEMRPSSHTEDTSSSDLDASVCDYRKTMPIFKLVKNYVRVIDRTWAEAQTRRANSIESYQSQIIREAHRHDGLMKEMKMLEDKALEFVQHFNTRIDNVMKDAAKSLLGSKLASKELRTTLAHETKCQDETMNKLRRQISKDLKKQVARIDNEDANL